MKPKLLGWLLKMTAILSLAILVRFEVNPILYFFLGMLFYLGWKVQNIEEPLPVKAKRKQHVGVIAKRV